MSTILEAFGLRKVTGYKSGHGVTEDFPLPDQLVGIELEIENFPVEYSETSFGGFTFTEDGSLRNRGCEAITKPVAAKHVPSLLEAFFLNYNINQNNYSERCSTHIHFNVLPLTTDQVSTICLIYQTVESLLFRWIGGDRENNIFCVPWNQCNLNYNIVTKMAQSPSHANDVFRRWQKYAALNLIPIATQGTMEFRHLYGTCDVTQISQWIGIVSQIFSYAQKVSLEEAQRSITNMNTVSNYHQWMNDVFGPLTSLLQYEGYEKQLSIGVVDSKLMLLKQEPMPWQVPRPRAHGRVRVLEELEAIGNPGVINYGIQADAAQMVNRALLANQGEAQAAMNRYAQPLRNAMAVQGQPYVGIFDDLQDREEE